MKLGIYIHLPFCKSKCFYCDFYSCANTSDIKICEYIDAVIEEILSQVEVLGQADIDTIYIGGGTPSLIDEKYILKLLDVIKLFCTATPEITIELNPESTTKEKLQAYYNAGINRISIGLQSVNNQTLKNIGRLAKLEDFKRVYDMAVDLGFTNISCDVMIGLPNETMEDFLNTVNYILALKKITHISAYSLEVHENTKLDFLINNNFLRLPNEDLEREMKHILDIQLEQAGFNRYEISNYAKPSFESKHNLKYWNQEYYLGFGAAASSYINGRRDTNISDIDKYIYNIKNGINLKEEIEEMDKLDMMKEYIILRLRLACGVNFKLFKDRFKQDINDIFKDKINMLISKGLLIKTNEKIALTYKGEDLANMVWQEFI